MSATSRRSGQPSRHDFVELVSSNLPAYSLVPRVGMSPFPFLTRNLSLGAVRTQASNHAVLLGQDRSTTTPRTTTLHVRLPHQSIRCAKGDTQLTLLQVFDDHAARLSCDETVFSDVLQAWTEGWKSLKEAIDAKAQSGSDEQRRRGEGIRSALEHIALRSILSQVEGVLTRQPKCRRMFDNEDSAIGDALRIHSMGIDAAADLASFAKTAKTELLFGRAIDASLILLSLVERSDTSAPGVSESILLDRISGTRKWLEEEQERRKGMSLKSSLDRYRAWLRQELKDLRKESMELASKGTTSQASEEVGANEAKQASDGTTGQVANTAKEADDYAADLADAIAHRESLQKITGSLASLDQTDGYLSKLEAMEELLKVKGGIHESDKDPLEALSSPAAMKLVSGWKAQDWPFVPIATPKGKGKAKQATARADPETIASTANSKKPRRQQPSRRVQPTSVHRRNLQTVFVPLDASVSSSVQEIMGISGSRFDALPGGRQGR